MNSCCARKIPRKRGLRRLKRTEPAAGRRAREALRLAQLLKLDRFRTPGPDNQIDVAVKSQTEQQRSRLHDEQEITPAHAPDRAPGLAFERRVHYRLQAAERALGPHDDSPEFLPVDFAAGPADPRAELPSDASPYTRARAIKRVRRLIN